MHIPPQTGWRPTVFWPIEKVRAVRRSTSAEKPDQLYGPPLINAVANDEPPPDAPGRDLDITI